MIGPAKKWCAVYTHARMEKWARSNLWERGHEVYCPEFLKQRRHARRTDWVSAPLFPRYLFVALDAGKPRRRSINSAAGVINLVTFGDRPAMIEDTIIQEIRAREDEMGKVQLVDRKSLIPGERIWLHSGALADHMGFFERQGDAERVVILLKLLGREVRVGVPSNSIARVL